MGRKIQKPLLIISFMITVMISSMTVMAARHDTVYNGVDYARVYDYDYYTSRVHPELSGNSDQTVLKYFVKNGIPAGEQAIKSFSVKSYRNANRDLRGTYGMKYSKYISQYISSGYAQGRTTTGYDDKIKDPVTTYEGQSYSRVYDFEYYKSKYAYIRNRFALDDFGALEFFVRYGMKKRHQACKEFNVVWYYNSNANMRYMCGLDWQRYYLYYQKKAYMKGAIRRCETLKNIITYYKIKSTKIYLSDIYDFEYYTKNNSRAMKYWRNQDDAGAVKDFVEYGMRHNLRGRKGSGRGPKSNAYKNIREIIYPDFDNNAYMKADGYSSKTKYLCLINQDEHKVYVFKGSKGNWKLKKKFTCTVGAPGTPTPMGVFEMYGKNRSEPMNYFDSGSCRCFYYSPFYRSYYFHSILYYQDPTPQRVMDGTLGANASHGCVRLALDNAKWIYKYVPNKTKVVSYNRKF